MPAPKDALAIGPTVYLRRPLRTDAAVFLVSARASQKLHNGWVQAPTTPTIFATYVDQFGGRGVHSPTAASQLGMLVCRAEDDAIVGVFNLSAIIQGVFQSAYMGYYAFSPYQGRGYMQEGMRLSLAVAFKLVRLHRVEVNVQPTNGRSIALARKAGFAREGFSPRYVKIGGRWRDHERWALLVETWRQQRRLGA